MALATVELHADADTVTQPVLWRLGKVSRVVFNVRRARVSGDSGYVLLDIQGSVPEIEDARAYLRAVGVLQDQIGSDTALAARHPEDDVPQPNAIDVRLSPVTAEQAGFPYLYRLGRDFEVVVNLVRASFDGGEEDTHGFMEIVLSGPLAAVQRAIAYLHTTGIHVAPRQRSVTDYGNL